MTFSQLKCDLKYGKPVLSVNQTEYIRYINCFNKLIPQCHNKYERHRKLNQYEVSNDVLCLVHVLSYYNRRYTTDCRWSWSDKSLVNHLDRLMSTKAHPLCAVNTDLTGEACFAYTCWAHMYPGCGEGREGGWEI